MLLDDSRGYRQIRDPAAAFFDVRLLFLIVVYVTALRRGISNATIARSDDRGFSRRVRSFAAKLVDRMILGRHNSTTVHMVLIFLTLMTVERWLLLLYQCHHTNALRGKFIFFLHRICFKMLNVTCSRMRLRRNNYRVFR
ncbi:hypothetical protein ALC57_17924 [Trachymyrmex cornetzi]|uniref:Uncharacterized protein n=1 Tax=Trachymyrmex cornetzi TaxID=471704 RepID=A0A195DAP8_9HYME|nr:hypothetical protein ALC57_17924 [Trachymyrmex cornetzi]